MSQSIAWSKQNHLLSEPELANLKFSGYILCPPVKELCISLSQNMVRENLEGNERGVKEAIYILVNKPAVNKDRGR